MKKWLVVISLLGILLLPITQAAVVTTNPNGSVTVDSEVSEFVIQSSTDSIGLEIKLSGESGAFVDDWDNSTPLGLTVAMLKEEAVGVRFNADSAVPQSYSFNDNVLIQASTAIESNQRIIFNGLKNSLVGDIKMTEGALSLGGGQTTWTEGQAEIGTLMIASGAQFEVNVNAMTPRLWTNQLIMNRGSLILNGRKPDALIRGSGAFVVAGQLNLSQGSSVSVKDNSVLIVSDRLKDLGETGLISIVGSANAYAGGEKATFITMGDSVVNIDETSYVAIGSGSDIKNGTVNLGRDSRWIYVVDPDASLMNNKVEASLQAVAQSNAQFVLWGWDGNPSSLPDLAAAGFTQDQVLVLGGVRGYWDGMQMQRIWAWQTEGLQSAQVIKEVESQFNPKNAEWRPGWRFITDSFSLERISQSAYADVMDQSLFLPATSGMSAAIDRARQTMLKTISEPVIQFGEGTHWWVKAWHGEDETNSIFSGVLGNWGYNAQSTSLLLGVTTVLFNTQAGNQWVGQASVGFTNLDLSAQAALTRSSSDVGVWFANLNLHYLTDEHDWQGILQYAQAQGDSQMMVNAHILSTEPIWRYLAVGGAWAHHPMTAWNWVPQVRMLAHWANMDEGIIEDNTGYTTGAGFDVKADDRYWVSLGSSLTARYTWRWLNTDITPHFGMDVEVAAGDCEWQLQTGLVGGWARSSAQFDATAALNAELSAGLNLARSGMTEDKPWGWALSADVAVGHTSLGQDHWRWELHYQQRW